MSLIAQLSLRTQDLARLEARMHLMLAVIIIAMIGLVLIIWTRAWARALRRRGRLQQTRAVRDEWAIRPLIERFPARLPRQPDQVAGSDAPGEAGHGEAPPRSDAPPAADEGPPPADAGEGPAE